MRWILCCFLTSFVWGDEQLPFNSPKWPAILAEEHQLPEKLCEFTHWKPGLKLADLKEVIEKQHGIKVRFDPFKPHIDDCEVGFSTRHTPLFQALNGLDHAHSLYGWSFAKNTLHIHGSDVSPTVGYYPVADFLELWTRDDLATMLIYNTAGPWFDLDGLGGTITFAGPVMVVNQTATIHRQIRQILRQFRSQEFPCRLLQNSRDSLITQRIHDARSFSFGRTSLIEFAHKLAQTWLVDVRLDSALTDYGVDLEREHRFSLSRGKIKTPSKEQLSVLAIDGQIFITTLEYASENLFTEVLDVKNVLPYFLDPEQLSSLVQQETPGPWLDTDGLGGVVELHGDGKLFVTNTEFSLRRSKHFMNRLRKDLVKHPGWRPKDELVTKTYGIPQGIQAKDFDQLLHEQIAPTTWSNPELQVYTVWKRFDYDDRPEMRLVVRHFESIHFAIQRLIDNLNSADWDEYFDGGSFGGR